MARARNIKPGLFKNEDLGTRDPILTLLFIGLWGLADREGRLEDRPLRINAEIFPYRGFTADEINGYLTELVALDLIWRFEAENVKVIQIVKFAKHQSPHNTEKPSELPARPNKIQGGIAITVNAPLSNENLTDVERPSSLIPSSLTPSLPMPNARARARACEDTDNAVNPETSEIIESYLSEVRTIYKVNVLSREDRWVDAVIEADRLGITPAQFAATLRGLLADKSRKYPVIPQNVIDAALHARAAKCATTSKPKFLH
jgi:hypothetical protein